MKLVKKNKLNEKLYKNDIEFEYKGHLVINSPERSPHHNFKGLIVSPKNRDLAMDFIIRNGRKLELTVTPYCDDDTAYYSEKGYTDFILLEDLKQ